MKKPLFLLRCVMLLFLGVTAITCKQSKEQSKLPKKETAAETKTPKPNPQKKQEEEWQEKIGLTSREIKNNKFYSFISDWYGVPYKYGGCQKAGVDCSCFTNILYEKVYEKKISRSAAEMFKLCDQVGIEDAKEGDLLFFKIGGKNISHVGVYIKNNYFVHSSTSSGVMVSSLEEAYYKKYFYCAGKMKNP